MTPFDHRPNDPDEIDWEDNPVSNALAWSSEKVFSKYCQTAAHYSSRISNYFWTDCSCCLFWRGFFVGSLPTFAVALLAAAMYAF